MREIVCRRVCERVTVKESAQLLHSLLQERATRNLQIVFYYTNHVVKNDFDTAATAPQKTSPGQHQPSNLNPQPAQQRSFECVQILNGTVLYTKNTILN